MKEKFQKFIMLVLAYMPTRLPETPAEHALWAAEIIELGEFPSNDSFRHAIATQVLHLPPNQLKKSQMSFVNSLRRSIANQTAFQVVQETKARSGELIEKTV